MQEYGGAGLQMLGLRMFAHIMAQPADARYEDHAGRAKPRHHLRIVAGAGRKPATGETELPRRGFDQRHHLDGKRDWLEPCETACRDCDLLLRGQAIDKVGKSLLGLLQPCFIGVAQVDGEDRPLRDHVHEIGVNLDAPDRATLMAAHVLREPAREQCDLAGGVGGVPPHVHRRRAGMR